MSFIYPLGLLGLIGVPVIIIIYILKNKFNEKTVSSTYIWNLSEKFLKKRNPLNIINGLLSLILQLLIVIVLSLSLAHPQFKIADSAQNYLYVIDASASMNFESNGKSRFENAIENVRKMVDESVDGSHYSLIYGAREAELLVSSSESKNDIYNTIDNLSCTEMAYSLDNTISLAQKQFNNDPSLNVYFFTDKTFDEISNVEVINLAEEEKNIAITDADYSYVSSRLVIDADITSYTENKEITITLTIDDNLIGEQKAEITTEKSLSVKFETELTSFKYASLSIKDEDNLSLDNDYCIYNIENETTINVLLVTDTPFYVSTILRTLDNVTYNVVSSADYNSEMRGYGLYIFDGYSPESVPDDGAVFFIGVKNNVPDSGFTMQDEIVLDQGGLLEYANGTSSDYEEITENTVGSKIYVGTYLRYNIISSFTTILSYDSYPMVFVGKNTYNYREIVFSFDLHKSNFPVLFDYAILMKNLINYSSPTLIENNVYVCGDTMSLNVLPHLESVKVDSPSGKSSYLDLSMATASFTLEEVGTYNVTYVISNEEQVSSVYVLFPEDEADPSQKEETLILEGTKEEVSYQGVFDNLLIFIIAAFVIFIGDWVVYCYEQRQLY